MKTKILVCVAVLSLWILWPGTGQHWVEINISEGENAHDVVKTLKEARLARSPIPFLVWVKLRRAQNKLQVGRYRISSGRSAFWIVDDIIQGRVEKTKFVIPEGFASWQIAERLGDLKLCDEQTFKEVVQKESLEGYLFPATYELGFGLSPTSLAHKFKSQFDARWTPDIDQRAKEVGLSKEQVVTLASIVEREVRKRDELALVAALYLNRLRKRMRLEADPTVQYALGYWKTRLTYDDYHSVKSPYNTYLNTGLPPGPICSPGWDTIKAVLWPAQSNALFLLAQEDGHHTFSETYREHTNKVNKRNRKKK